MERTVPDISVDEAEKHDKMIKYIRHANDMKMLNVENANSKSMMTFQSYVSTIDEDPDNLENILLPSDLDLILLNFEKNNLMLDLKMFQNLLVQVLKRKNRSPINIFSRSAMNKKSELLFNKIDWLKDGVISWENFCSYFLYRFKDDKKLEQASPFEQKEKFIKFPSLKDSIAKLVVDSNTPSKYILVTKDGLICNLASELSIKSNIQVLNVDSEKSKIRSKKIWVTDMICVPAINKLVVSTASRDMQFYEMSTPNYLPQFHLLALPNAALCLCQFYMKVLPHNKLYIFFGTDNGSIHMLKFHVPQKSLFDTPFQKTKSSWHVLFTDISNHASFVTHKILSQSHHDWVLRIQYVHESNTVVSCSNDPKHSLLCQSTDEKETEKLYRFHVKKGVQCFDYNKNIGLLATGSVDHALRFWDPYVTARPTAILKLHQASIIDLSINEQLNLVFSYSKDAHLCLFDVKDHLCVQSIHLKFPPAERIFEHGVFPMLSTSRSVLVVAEDCLAELQLSSSSLKSAMTSTQTHHSSVVKALCIQSRNEIVTVCEAGKICVWDVRSGHLLKIFMDSTVIDEASAIAVDCTGEWLICGYVGGVGAIWNLLTGLKDKSLEKYESKEITSIIVLPNKSTVFMFGWSRKIQAYYDSALALSLKPDETWLSIRCHQDDILCAVLLTPMLFATSSFDGDIFIWNIEYKKISTKVQIGQNNLDWRKNIFQNMNRSMRSGLRSSKSRRSKGSLSSTILLEVAVECLLYLPLRHQRCHASLVSSHASTLTFWNISDAEAPVASFHATDSNQASITALISNASNTLLLTGDSEGLLMVWDIEAYAVHETFSQILTQKHSSTNEKTPSNISPSLLQSWVAHENAVITSLEVYMMSSSTSGDEMYIVSSSTDCCVIIWTWKGVKIGLFSHIGRWNLDATLKMKNEVPSKREDRHFFLNNVEHVNNVEQDGITKERGQLLPQIDVNPASVSIANDLLFTDVKNIKATESYKIRLDISDRIEKMKESWSKLGENYNSEFRRRMSTRKLRRSNCSEISESLYERGGVNNICTPFNALSLRDTDNYELPKGLPVTPRMISKSINPYNSSSLNNIHLLGST